MHSDFLGLIWTYANSFDPFPSWNKENQENNDWGQNQQVFPLKANWDEEKKNTAVVRTYFSFTVSVSETKPQRFFLGFSPQRFFLGFSLSLSQSTKQTETETLYFVDFFVFFF